MFLGQKKVKGLMRVEGCDERLRGLVLRSGLMQYMCSSVCREVIVSRFTDCAWFY